MKHDTKHEGERLDTAQMIADSIIKMLERGVCPWKQDWNKGAGGLPRSIDGKNYRGMNLLLLGLFASQYELPVFLTFNRCKALGGKVKKGEHGYIVVFYKPSHYFEKDDKGNIVRDENGKPKTHEYLILRYYKVFNVAQCEGLPEKYTTVPNRVEYHHDPIAAAEDIWNGYADKPTLVTKGLQPCYIPSKDIIEMPAMSDFKSAEGYYAALFHEASHSTGHEKRLNRKSDEKMPSFFRDKSDYGFEELVAEISAQMLCQHAGIATTLENTAAYCESWAKALKDAPARSIVAAAGKAQKSADYILGIHPDEKATTQPAE